MLSFSNEEFKNQTFACNDGSIIFQDKSFVEGPTFSQHHYAKAVEYCKQYAKSGILCLLQEGAFYFTVWLQKLESEESRKLAENNPNSSESSSTARWFKGSSSSLKNALNQTSNKQVHKEGDTSTLEFKSPPEEELPEPEIKDLEFSDTLDSLIDNHFGEQQSSDTLEFKSTPEEDLSEPETKDLEFDDTLNSLIEHHFGEQISSEISKKKDDSIITDQVATNQVDNDQLSPISPKKTRYRGVDYEVHNNQVDDGQTHKESPKKIRYRGVDYEVHNSQLEDFGEESSSAKKGRKKYRGQSY